MINALQIVLSNIWLSGAISKQSNRASVDKEVVDPRNKDLKYQVDVGDRELNVKIKPFFRKAK